MYKKVDGPTAYLCSVGAERHRHHASPQLGLSVVLAGAVKERDCPVPATDYCAPRMAKKRKRSEAGGRYRGPDLGIRTAESDIKTATPIALQAGTFFAL